MASAQLWSPAAIEMLRKLHLANQSAGTISRALELAGYKHTRNAVISQARRLKLKNDRIVGRKQMPGETLRRPRLAKIVVRECEREPTPAEHLSRRTGRLIDLDSRQCRFPFGPIQQRPPYVFCCEDARPDSSFCEVHHARVFVPLTSRPNLYGFR